MMMYDMCVKYNGTSDFYKVNCGLFQGEILSPILFTLFVNDLDINFINNNCTSLDIRTVIIFLLMYMYADDIVLLSESPDDLQIILNSLQDYTTKCRLTVNVQKTKIIVFRNGRTIRNNEKWYYNNEPIEVVNEFNYLGLMLNYNGKCFKTQKHISEQGKKSFVRCYECMQKQLFLILKPV